MSIGTWFTMFLFLIIGIIFAILDVNNNTVKNAIFSQVTAITLANILTYELVAYRVLEVCDYIMPLILCSKPSVVIRLGHRTIAGNSTCCGHEAFQLEANPKDDN